MATISGVPVENLVKVSDVAASTIQNISGIPTSNIPGWPSAGPSCTTVYYGYSDGRRTPPEQACFEPPYEYALSSNGSVLYIGGFCGIIAAVAGFYSDGGTIYFFDGVSSFFPYSACGR